MLIIFFLEFKKINKNVFLVITNFIKKNIFIILGLIFAFIVSITRSDIQTVVAAIMVFCGLNNISNRFLAIFLQRDTKLLHQKFKLN